MKLEHSSFIKEIDNNIYFTPLFSLYHFDCYIATEECEYLFTFKLKQKSVTITCDNGGEELIEFDWRIEGKTDNERKMLENFDDGKLLCVHHAEEWAKKIVAIMET